MHSDPGFLARVAGATLMALLAGTAPAADLARASACKGPAPCVLAPRALWQGDAPTLKDWPGTAPHAGPDEVRDDGDVVFNVTRPSYQAFLPAPGKATGAAVLVAPGGGFIYLSLRNEGTEVARWLAEHGIAAFVLRYRTFYQAPGESRDDVMKRMLPAMGSGQAGAASVADGMEALRQIRAHAAEFGIDPHRIGGVGFSAGAHVVGMMALAPDERERLDFVGLVYGLPIGVQQLPPANLPFPPGTPKEVWLQPAPTPAPGAMPPTFLAMAQDDVLVGQGVRRFYDDMFAAGYRPEVHLFVRGHHGFGMKPQGSTSDHWMDMFHGWIEALGFTASKGGVRAPG